MTKAMGRREAIAKNDGRISLGLLFGIEFFGDDSRNVNLLLLNALHTMNDVHTYLLSTKIEEIFSIVQISIDSMF